jgi:hypothetical protein
LPEYCHCWFQAQVSKGAAIIAAAIGIGDLNIIILPLIAMANPVIPTGAPNAKTIWAYWIPRVVHDVISFWSIAFWVRAVWDAISLTRVKQSNGSDQDFS